MSLAEQIASMSFAALLALAALFAWPPEDQCSVSDNDRVETSSLTSHHTYSEQQTAHGVPRVIAAVTCDGLPFGCCAMSVCHPAMSVEGLEMPSVAGEGETTVVSGQPGRGSEPEVILPPPRPVPA